ncbi:MAG: bifunctional nuclease domain-containing protein [Planctomycetota bacterium]
MAEVAMELSRVVISETGDRQIIYLRERDGDRTFPIIIGIAEALAIDRRLKGIPTPRPMTHDLLANVIRAMGGEIEKVVVNDLQEHTFIATLYIRQDGELVEVDSRPSDAIALGAAFETPIYVADEVLDAVLAPPATMAERLELLRKRKNMLEQSIEELDALLNDEDFLENAPEQVVQQQRQQLNEMQAEHDAIEEVLRKHG